MNIASAKRVFMLPAVIILAGIVISGALYIARSHRLVLAPAPSPSVMRPVGPTDHIIGRPDAPVVIVDYSDIDCQYCKSFQQSMEQLMADYGTDGKVAWVYRHFPLMGLHQYAETHAEAAECVASLGGESRFWQFIDALQQAAPGINQFNPAGYGPIIANLGINDPAFESCMQAHTYAKRVQGDFENALASGATEAPYAILMISGQKPVPIHGALPYDSLKKIIDQAIAKATQ